MTNVNKGIRECENGVNWGEAGGGEGKNRTKKRKIGPLHTGAWG